MDLAAYQKKERSLFRRSRFKNHIQTHRRNGKKIPIVKEATNGRTNLHIHTGRTWENTTKLFAEWPERMGGQDTVDHTLGR
jgi:hypothetical protein